MTIEKPIDVQFDGRSKWLPSRKAAERLLQAAQLTSLLVMTAMVATKGWQNHVGAGFVLAGTSAVLWAPALRRRTLQGWWFFYVAGIFIYTLLRSLADETVISPLTSYPILLDDAFALGRNPTREVQEMFFDSSSPNWLDRFAVGWHWSFFVLPHAWAIAVFIFDRGHFRRFILAMLLTWYAGLVLFFIIPTTPPWLAAQEGSLEGVVRIMDFVGRDAFGNAYGNVQATFGEPNSVAAMPSLHIAITLLLVLFAFNRARWLGSAMALYCLLMVASLLYLGEHYLVDMAVGAAMAILCYAVVARWTGPGSSGHAPVDGRGSGSEADIGSAHDHFASTDEEIATGFE